MRRTAGWLALGLVLSVSGCADGAPPDESTPPALEARNPEFTGKRPLVLTAGTRAFLDPPCVSDPPRRVCSADGATTYLCGIEPYEVTLVRASMRPDEGHTAWVVRLRFEQSATVVAAAEAALGAGGLLLVLDGDVAIAAHLVRTEPEPSVRAGGIDLEALPKADAADLIRSLAE